jgi:hypothetical protein
MVQKFARLDIAVADIARIRQHNAGVASLDLFRRFRPTILAASETEIRSDPTLAGRLVMARTGSMEIAYAPFDHVNVGARVVIVGVTPGAQQASNALLAARAAARAGRDDQEALAEAKVFASFSGAMRSNLVAMLDYIGLSAKIGVRSCGTLWTSDNGLAHFTSALRYPVFVGGHNYSGAPAMTRTPMLRGALHEYLAAEANALPAAVWIPLGPAATEGVREVVRMGKLDPARVLEGLPHPSGANAERIAYFLGRKMREMLSVKTSASTIDAARERLMAQVAGVTATPA